MNMKEMKMMEQKTEWFLPWVRPKPFAYKKWSKRRKLKWLKAERHWPTVGTTFRIDVDPTKWKGVIGGVE